MGFNLCRKKARPRQHWSYPFLFSEMSVWTKDWHHSLLFHVYFKLSTFGSQNDKEKSDIRWDRTNYFTIAILTYQFENKLNLVLSSTSDTELLAEVWSCHQQEIFLIRNWRTNIKSFTPAAISGKHKPLSMKLLVIILFSINRLKSLFFLTLILHKLWPLKYLDTLI